MVAGPEVVQRILDCRGRNASDVILPVGAPLTHAGVLQRIRQLHERAEAGG